MDCGICSRTDEKTNEFFCTSCARNAIYLTRLHAAQVLLQKEELGKEVESIIHGARVKRPDSDDTPGALRRTWTNIGCTAGKERHAEWNEDIRLHIDVLRNQLEEKRESLVRQKAALAVRRSDLNTIKVQIPSRQQTQSSKITETYSKGTASFNNNHSNIVNTKAFLCREAATLLRMKQKKRMKSGVVKDQYTITGLLLPDLREINNLRCTDLTASLTSVAQLLVLVAFYTGVRLPAEITLPHRDYPLPTINTPTNSYLLRKIAFPGSGSSLTGTGSPTTAKQESKNTSRPRPLFVDSDDRDERVAQFAKKDPTAFNFFVEAISLLAWDIAWLCRSQGFITGTDTWGEVCNIGQNLWQLLLAHPQSPALLRALSSRDVQARQKTSTNVKPASPPLLDVNAKLGERSHTSAHSFLGTDSADVTRGWKLSKYNIVKDSLQKTLLTEMNNAEWELLEEQEWDDGGEQFDEAVFIKTRAMDGHGWDDARSIMTTRTRLDDDDTMTNASTDTARTKGTSGWTKVKSRDKG